VSLPQSAASHPVAPPPLRVEQALRLLPDIDDLAPLRGCVVSLSSNRSPGGGIWAGADPNGTIGKRTLDPGALRSRMPLVLDRVTRRVAVLYDAAVDALESEQSGDMSQAVRALVRAGEFEERSVRFSHARAWYRQALGIAEQLRDRQPEMETLCHLGRLESTRGYLDEGARAYQRSLALAEAEYDHAHAAGACQGLGDVLFAQSQWVGAEAWFSRGLQYAGANHTMKGSLSLGLAQTALRRRDYGAAAEHAKVALESFESARDSSGIVRALLTRGLIEAAQGKRSDVLVTYREALARLPTSDVDGVLELAVRLNLAEIYLELGRLPDAEDEARRAENLAVINEQQGALARVYVIMGRLRGRQGDESGFVFFEQAIQLCRSGEPARRLEVEVYREYARFRTTMGDRDEARAYLERARDLLEPFGDDAARDRIAGELRELDLWVGAGTGPVSDSSRYLNP